jgi:hypothetical protein
MFLVALAAGWLIAGAAGIASAQSQSDTRQLMLFDAVRQNNLDQVHSIIQAGIDVARPDASGRTAVDLTVQNGHFGIAQHLILTRRLQQQSLTAAAPAPPIRAPAPIVANVVIPQVQAVARVLVPAQVRAQVQAQRHRAILPASLPTLVPGAHAGNRAHREIAASGEQTLQGRRTNRRRDRAPPTPATGGQINPQNSGRAAQPG